MGRIHFRESGGCSGAIGGMVSNVGRKIPPLEFTKAALGETDRVRRGGKLEVDLRELFGVLSLPGCAPDALEGVSVRFGGERSVRRAVPWWVHVDQERRGSNDERQSLRVASGRHQEGR